MAYEVIALLAQQDPEIADLTYQRLFPAGGSRPYLSLPDTLRDCIEMPEAAMARKAIEEARKAHQEGRLPPRPVRSPKGQRPSPAPASSASETAPSTPDGDS